MRTPYDFCCHYCGRVLLRVWGGVTELRGLGWLVQDDGSWALCGRCREDAWECSWPLAAYLRELGKATSCHATDSFLGDVIDAEDCRVRAAQ